MVGTFLEPYTIHTIEIRYDEKIGEFIEMLIEWGTTFSEYSVDLVCVAVLDIFKKVTHRSQTVARVRANISSMNHIYKIYRAISKSTHL